MEPAEPTLLNPEAPAIREMVYLPPPPPPAPPKQRVWLHVLLFVMTIASTWILRGPVFSAALLSILTAHEFGHYFTARKYRVPVSLPYFIPFPFSLFGTMGAFIRMSPRIPHRRALFDIAAAGPLAGLVLAVPLTFWGITLSTIVPKNSFSTQDTLILSDPLLFRALGWLAHGSLGNNMDLLMHPLAFAGWAGMFVTALNLLPIGQLDGGHVTHSLFGHRSRLVAGAMFGGLALFCLVKRNITWIPLLLFLLFFGIHHPHSADDGEPLGGERWAIGILLGAVFVTCFSLVPINI